MPDLHDYQETAKGYLRANDRACLFLDMGLFNDMGEGV